MRRRKTRRREVMWNVLQEGSSNEVDQGIFEGGINVSLLMLTVGDEYDNYLLAFRDRGEAERSRLCEIM